MARTVVCHFYNEEFLLPWWLKHHKQIFDHGIMINYASIDSSVNIIKEICPTWTIVDSRYAFFESELIDTEVMEIESKVKGWRIALNVTEFLYGNYDHLTDRDEMTQYLLSNYIFVDMEDESNHPTKLDHNRPIHEQRYWGFCDGTIDPGIGGMPRLNRSIHNFPVSYTWGRHWPDTKASFDDLVIFYFGYADLGEKGIKRRLQIKDKIRPEQLALSHHNITEEQIRKQFKEFYQPRSINLSNDVSHILEHNRRITGQHW